MSSSGEDKEFDGFIICALLGEEDGGIILLKVNGPTHTSFLIYRLTSDSATQLGFMSQR